MLNEVKNKLFSKIDVWLLTSILLIMNVSTSFKLLGVLILFFYKPTILKSIKQNKFSLFYLLMIGIVLLQVLFRISDINESIIKINLIASIIWGISLFALIQITRIVSDIEITKIQNTIVVLFLINAVYSIGELVGIMLEIGTINPYTYNSLVINPLTDMSLYGGATGDYIGGVFRTHSIHNAFFNLIGVIYFLMNKKYLMSMISLIILLLTTSNLVVLILFFTIFSVLFFHPSKTTKYVVLLLVLISTVFYAKVSPNNFEYARKTLVKSNHQERNDILLNKIKLETDEKIKNQKIAKYISHKIATDSTISEGSKKQFSQKQKIESQEKDKRKVKSNKSLNDIIITDNKEAIVEKLAKYTNQLDSVLIGFRVDSSVDSLSEDDYLMLMSNEQEVTSVAVLKKMSQFKVDLDIHHANLRNKVFETYKDSSLLVPPENLQKYPGKAISYIETLQYLTSSPSHLLLGSGAGQFSSKLAFGISGFSISDGGNKRMLNRQVNYISDDFKENHLKLFSYYWLKDPGEHSISTEPFSVYNQIAGEYGLLGIAAFIFSYLFFYLKRIKRLKTGRYLLIAVLLMLFSDYWFEHLNIIIVFELLMSLELKRNDYER